MARTRLPIADYFEAHVATLRADEVVRELVGEDELGLARVADWIGPNIRVGGVHHCAIACDLGPTGAETIEDETGDHDFLPTQQIVTAVYLKCAFEDINVAGDGGKTLIGAVEDVLYALSSDLWLGLAANVISGWRLDGIDWTTGEEYAAQGIVTAHILTSTTLLGYREN